MGLNLFQRKRCLNCQFLSQNILYGDYSVDKEEREQIKKGEFEHEHHNLKCYHDYWSEGSSPKQDIYHTVCEKDRSDCPSYLEYDSDYKTFPSAEKILERKIEKKKTRNKYLFRTFLAFLTASIALIGGIFSEELKEFFIHVYDKIVQYLK